MMGCRVFRLHVPRLPLYPWSHRFPSLSAGVRRKSQHLPELHLGAVEHSKRSCKRPEHLASCQSSSRSGLARCLDQLLDPTEESSASPLGSARTRHPKRWYLIFKFRPCCRAQDKSRTPGTYGRSSGTNHRRMPSRSYFRVNTRDWFRGFRGT